MDDIRLTFKSYSYIGLLIMWAYSMEWTHIMVNNQEYFLSEGSQKHVYGAS